MKHCNRPAALARIAALGGLSAAAASAQTVVISDTFETNTSANYTVVDDLAPDGTQTFGFDYVAAGIPPAPRSAGGTTRGLQLTANDTAGTLDAFTVFHNTAVNASRYRMTVDVFNRWTTFGPTTEMIHVGVAGDGATLNSIFSPLSGAGAYLAFSADGDVSSDYRWYRDGSNTPAGETDQGAIPAAHPSYLGHGSQNTGAFFTGLFPAPPSTVAGTSANIWTTVVIEVDNATGTISFSFDNQLTFQGAFSGTFNGRVSLGLTDPFSSISPASDQYTIFDNLVVETFSGPIGTNYCTAVANSTGQFGNIRATGSTVASANNVALQATALPLNAFGFFLTSVAQGFVANPGGSQGNLCLSGGIGRYVGPGQIKNSGSVGSFALTLDLTRTPTPTGLVAVTAGQTWNFQAWHRDSVGGTATSNFTNGVSVAFQ